MGKMHAVATPESKRYDEKEWLCALALSKAFNNISEPGFKSKQKS